MKRVIYYIIVIVLPIFILSVAPAKMIKDRVVTATYVTINKQSQTIQHAPTATYWVTINKTSNTLTLFRGKQRIKNYPVATGKKWTSTPHGKFIIANKLVNPEWFHIKGGIPKNPLGYRWMGLNIKNGWIYGIHGNNKPASIGTYASDGCIRMFNKDVAYLFEILPVRTPVWIGSQKELIRWGVY